MEPARLNVSQLEIVFVQIADVQSARIVECMVFDRNQHTLLKQTCPCHLSHGTFFNLPHPLPIGPSVRFRGQRFPELHFDSSSPGESVCSLRSIGRSCRVWRIVSVKGQFDNWEFSSSVAAPLFGTTLRCNLFASRADRATCNGCDGSDQKYCYAHSCSSLQTHMGFVFSCPRYTCGANLGLGFPFPTES